MAAACDGDSSRPWVLRLGSYLNDKKPAPWTILANKKPHDPLALRLGTFLNELGSGEVSHAPPHPTPPDIIFFRFFLN